MRYYLYDIDNSHPLAFQSLTQERCHQSIFTRIDQITAYGYSINGTRLPESRPLPVAVLASADPAI